MMGLIMLHIRYCALASLLVPGACQQDGGLPKFTTFVLGDNNFVLVQIGDSNMICAGVVMSVAGFPSGSRHSAPGPGRKIVNGPEWVSKGRMLHLNREP